MSRFSLFRWGKSKADSEVPSRNGSADRFVADDVDRKKTSNQKSGANDPQLPQKKRARRRLVGSITLVVAAIIVLPMIFESEPKQVSPNLLIDIPSKDKPVQVAATERTSPAATTETTVTPPANQAQVPVADVAQTAPSAPVEPAAPVPAAEQMVTPAEKTAAATSADVQKKQAEAQLKAEKARQEKLKAEKARAEKEKAEKTKAEKAKSAASADPIGQMIADKNAKTSGKQVIQVAALTSPQKVSELQAKLSRAGIRSHTQKVASKNGEERIRVRVGPLPKADADKTCAKLKGMGLSCTLLPN